MATATTAAPVIDKPPFILTQGMRLLTEIEHPRKYLAPEYFRAGRLAAGKPERRDHQDTDNVWTNVDRWDVASDRVVISEQPVSLHRLVFVTDAGIGKTTNLHWACCELCGEESDQLAFCLPIAELVPPGTAGPQWDDIVRGKLLSLLRQALGREGRSLSEPMAEALFDRLLAAGRIVLLLDALDQLPANSPALSALLYLLGHKAWQSCRIILVARPYALERHWDELFADRNRGWRFVQLDEFDEPQQREFLGRAPGADRDRLDIILEVIEEEARRILTVPRVLEMIRELPIGALAGLRTASDVYWRAVCHLVEKGLADRDARMLGAPVGSHELVAKDVAVAVALKLLAALAFEMVATKVPLAKEMVRDVRGRDWEKHRLAPGEQVPNFDRVSTDDFETYCERVFARVKQPHYGNNYPHFSQDLTRLEAMNTFLSHGLLDVGELKQMQFRNRSLQEFLAALWMARHYTEEDPDTEEDPAEEKDPADLSGWLYRTEDPLSEEYYWVWRFATEMPPQARRAEAWIRAIKPLYAPGDGTPENTIRSTEMIRRSWETMHAYTADVNTKIQSQAREILEKYQTEFSEILDWRHLFTGRWGWRRWWVARRFASGFVTIPAGEFTMGSPDTEADRDSDERQHQAWITKAFQLHRYQATNTAYELFDPAHASKRDTYSNKNEQPAIYVSWYDAWCFSKWVCFAGKCCHLPTEAQWEYACRAGTTTPFHFGSISDGTQSNVAGTKPYGTTKKGRSLGKTSRVGSYPESGFGLCDMHGNVWEWCADWYGEYPEDEGDDPIGPSSGEARVLRGGSCYFCRAGLSRAAYRGRYSPGGQYVYYGFRLARTP